MGLPVKREEEQIVPGGSLARRAGIAPSPPVLMNASDAAKNLKLTEEPAVKGGRKQREVLKGLRDLQQLQKQTIAVLESVRDNLSDIQNVLRSPEATRGVEKQRNAAALLAKGFSRDAVVQARGAVDLLPANPEPHLLLSLALAADQQDDEALTIARRGLALFDARQHGMGIEAALLHAISSLGQSAEAADRWMQIIATLPLKVLLENLARIAVCYPIDCDRAALDEALAARLTRALAELNDVRRAPNREEIEATTMLAALDAAHEHKLAATHRAVLVHVAQRAKLLREPTDSIRFLNDFVVPLGNRGLTRSATGLGRQTLKALMQARADAMTLHRAMQKLQLAGATMPTQQVSQLLWHWAQSGRAASRTRLGLSVGALLMVLGTSAGAWTSGYVPNVPMPPIGPWAIDLGNTKFMLTAFHVSLGILCLGALVGVIALMQRCPHVELPNGRQSLTKEELAYLARRDVRWDIRSALTKA